jgi:hypothetical protein
MKFRKTILVIVAALAGIAIMAGMSACGASKADVAAHNLSLQAEQFKIPRRIVAINGITDKYLLVVTGYCSVETTNSALGGSLEITCQVTKDGKNKYYKDFLGLSDNVSYTVEQLNTAEVSISHYSILFRPETIIPSFTR